MTIRFFIVKPYKMIKFKILEKIFVKVKTQNYKKNQKIFKIQNKVFNHQIFKKFKLKIKIINKRMKIQLIILINLLIKHKMMKKYCKILNKFQINIEIKFKVN